jgi:gamma-glutamyltranspeptidase/glutathione hydrolase
MQLTTIARWLVALPGTTRKPTPGCNHASNGRLGLTTNTKRPHALWVESVRVSTRPILQPMADALVSLRTAFVSGLDDPDVVSSLLQELALRHKKVPVPARAALDLPETARARGRHDRRDPGVPLIFLRLAVVWVAMSSPALADAPPAVASEKFMVVSAHRLATEAGASVLRAGGNAIDAAVAVGYTEAVVNPCCGNIGGGGFLVARLADGRDVFLNFRETAPAAATPTMYLDGSRNLMPLASVFGWRSVAVPGTVLGLDTALARYGTMSRARVMAPAIRLAREGFVLTRADTAILDAGKLNADPQAASVFRHADGSRFQPGETLVQPALADTLVAIAADGPDAFYRGRIPAAVEAAATVGGGIITAADFAAYRVTEDSPIRCLYRGWDIRSAPPPSSGGVTLCEILNVLEGFDLRAMGFHSVLSVHLMTEAMRHAYLDRNTWLGDPAFVQNPLERLLSKGYAAEIRERISARATPSADLGPGSSPHEKPETTHLSVMDAAGNAVALTYTINGPFGAGVMAPGAGFLLNDEMDDFATKPGAANMFGLTQGSANVIAPGKRPLSSMAPTVVLRDGRVAMVLGSPGGPRIITVVLEVLLNVIDHGMAAQAAVDAARLHMQYLPDTLFAEHSALSPDTAAPLRWMGYSITKSPPWGAAEVILVWPGGKLVGANDPRRPAGSAVGE